MILNLVKLPTRLAREENFPGTRIPGQLSCSQEEAGSDCRAWSLLQGTLMALSILCVVISCPVHLKGSVLNWKQSQLSTPRHVAVSGDIFGPEGGGRDAAVHPVCLLRIAQDKAGSGPKALSAHFGKPAPGRGPEIAQACPRSHQTSL